MNEVILKRIQSLIEEGESIKTTRNLAKRNPFPHPRKSNRGISYSSTVTVVPYVEPGAFEEWRTKALSLIEGITDPESVYQRNFQEEVNEPHVTDVDKGIGILRALKNDIEQGYLTKYRFKVVAEVFGDFLEMSGYLLENDYQDAAASLVGAVLEDGLRQLCRKNNIKVNRSDGIDSLNKKLARKGTYTTTVKNRILAWKKIRNSADHGKWDDYKKEDVQRMLRGVKRFLGENLK
jgi:hypothetical protein